MPQTRLSSLACLLAGAILSVFELWLLALPALVCALARAVGAQAVREALQVRDGHRGDAVQHKIAGCNLLQAGGS